ncbi:MAG: tetratricopeptide repeat protein [Delftia acidovorans]|jgi:non-specific serine/threonine protein kinase|nr:tetratricopeptide repeat protein [Delftia acidovorans]
MSKEDERLEPISYRYRFGTAQFDEAKFELRVAGLPVEVERRALEVLLYLLRHAGEVATKEALFREVWAGRVTVDKVLPNAINKLRRALGQANAELIVTQARVGYRLAAPVERHAVGRMPPGPVELAAGRPVPGRPHFALSRPLHSHGASEVWLAENARTGEVRVYKFAADEDRLRTLQREVTLSRVLAENLEDGRHFARVVDWNFEKPPFFLECEYGGESLPQWAPAHLAGLDAAQRVELFLQLADAVAAAHSVGVLHKDLKPANVLVAQQPGGWLLRLTDFGSGHLTDPERLRELGMTETGLAQSLDGGTLCTPALHLAPEVIAGQAPTAQSDVYALGLTLYQLLAGSMTKPLAPGWEEDVPDALLREDVRLATDGNPARRLAGAAELATRLRGLARRRQEAEHARILEEQARRAGLALERSRARRPYLIACMVALLACTGVVLWFYQAARTELARANAVNHFLNEDLLLDNPVLAKGQSALVKDLLLAVRSGLSQRFAEQPLIEAGLRDSFASIFNTMGLKAEAVDDGARALALYEREQGASHMRALTARALLARYHCRHGDFDAALEQLHRLEALTPQTADVSLRYLKSSAWGLYHMGRQESVQALAELRAAIALQGQLPWHNQSLWDWLRMDEITLLNRTGQPREALLRGERLAAELQARGDGYVLRASHVQGLLAQSLLLLDDAAGAEARLLKAQRPVLALLGPDHPRNLALLTGMGEVRRWQGDWPAAVRYTSQVHERLRAGLGEDHIETELQSLSLGQLLYEAGRAREALPLLESAHAGLLRRFGAQGPATARAAFWLAADRIELGQTEAALPMLGELDAQMLESQAAAPAWASRLDALRGLLMERRADASAAEVLHSALAGLQAQEPPGLCGALCLKAAAALERSGR